MILQRTYNLLCFSKPQNSYQYCCLSWNCRFSTKENSVVSSNSSCFFGPQLRLMPGTSISDVKCLTLCIGQHIQKVYKDQTAEVHQELTFVIHCYQKGSCSAQSLWKQEYNKQRPYWTLHRCHLEEGQAVARDFAVPTYVNKQFKKKKSVWRTRSIYLTAKRQAPSVKPASRLLLFLN